MRGGKLLSYTLPNAITGSPPYAGGTMTRTPKRSTISNSLLARYPVTLTAADLLAAHGAEQDALEPIDFTPVPRLRRRRGGWSEPAQRDFIACLRRTGSVASSARAHIAFAAFAAFRS